MNVICDYCGQLAVLTTGRELYPHRPELSERRFYACAPCGATVGCHPGTEQPLGRLANADLRRARSAAHAAFDPLWKDGGISRTRAYRWLAAQLDVKSEACHIGLFDVPTCRRVVEVCRTISPPPGEYGDRMAVCDCENPEPVSGAALVSMECPIHNENPRPVGDKP